MNNANATVTLRGTFLLICNMKTDEKLAMMIENYVKKRDRAQQVSVMEFHQKHILLFLNRFRQLSARFETPSSSLLSHDIFLVVKAATIVAKADWKKREKSDSKLFFEFSNFFSKFDLLSAELGPLNELADACVEALENNSPN